MLWGFPALGRGVPSLSRHLPHNLAELAQAIDGLVLVVRERVEVPPTAVREPSGRVQLGHDGEQPGVAIPAGEQIGELVVGHDLGELLQPVDLLLETERWRAERSEAPRTRQRVDLVVEVRAELRPVAGLEDLASRVAREALEQSLGVDPGLGRLSGDPDDTAGDEASDDEERVHLHS